ncbi:hypothetical protein B0H66DRAFT_541949 [Apodospora peruviana]|uniref:Uncharacterized protein n=1 Tax=Apodospora peruviana TaxID=516989 RepID=A0AAE0IRN8_9PEZI|nr:hypothetical protein B0H66DRAFT_541949 [Apodospora peruviana]
MQGRPYWGALPQSPARSPLKPRSESTQQRTNMGNGRIGEGGKKPQAAEPSQEKAFAIKRRPVPDSPPPKQDYQQSPQTQDNRLIPTDSSHSESVRRSLSQQQQLSSLIPSGHQSAAVRPKPSDQGCPQPPVIPTTKEDPVPATGANNIQSRSSSQEKVLDKFAKELEAFAKVTEVPRNVPTATSTTSEAHDSVKTVQELLPYRQQFQEAGLAVTSLDQRVPPKSRKRLPHRLDSSADDRLRFDGGVATSQGSSAGTKWSSNDSVVPTGEPGPMSLVPADKPRPRELKQRADSKQLTGKRVAGNPKEGMQPSHIFPGSNKAQTTVERGRPPRPSAGVLVNKPLPPRPASSRPTNQSDTRGMSKGLPVPEQPNTDSKTSLSPPIERELPQIPAEESYGNISPNRPTLCGPELPGTRTVEKCLPALPMSRVSSQLRYGAILLGHPSWGSAARQLPTTIVEEKEPSPEKQKAPLQNSSATRNNGNLVAQTRVEENSYMKTTVKASTSDLGCKPELLPETWKHAIGTPSSFEKALDSVVRKLDDMEEKAPVVAEKPIPQGHRGTSSRAHSPSQRLQRAASLRRHRMVGVPARSPDPVERSTSPTTASESPLKQREGSTPSTHNTVKAARGDGNSESAEEAQDDKDISDGDVLKGLKIICAASADQDLDAWIRSKTGLRLRRFLADLKTFEHLSEDGILAVNDQRARRRLSQRRKLHEEARRSRSMRRHLH